MQVKAIQGWGKISIAMHYEHKQIPFEDATTHFKYMWMTERGTGSFEHESRTWSKLEQAMFSASGYTNARRGCSERTENSPEITS